MKNIVYILILLLIPSFLSCASNIAEKAGFTKEYIKAGDFTLMTYQKFDQHSDTLNIYIEGDGRAWVNKHTLSDDPTPSNPVALKLAAADPGSNIAYIARPGQYPMGQQHEGGCRLQLKGAVPFMQECSSKYWSASRFAPEVVSSMDQAIEQLKARSKTRYVQLTGYSGGGAIAVLVAARRGDVTALRTVAGNLNTVAWCNYHHISQLENSLNPLDAASRTVNIPQRHFVGGKDKIMPYVIAGSFVKSEGDIDESRISIVKNATHNNGWDKQWKELMLILPSPAVGRAREGGT